MILVGMGVSSLHFQWEKKERSKNDDDEIFAGVCTKRAHSFMSGENDFQGRASVYHQNDPFITVCSAVAIWILHLATLRYQ